MKPKTKSKPRPHNPDNLTRKQIGHAPWRLLDVDEIKRRTRAYHEIEGWCCNEWLRGWYVGNALYTYRTRLTRAQLRRLK